MTPKRGALRRGTWSGSDRSSAAVVCKAQLVTNQVSDNFFMSWAEYDGRSPRSTKRSSSGPYCSQRHSLATNRLAEPPALTPRSHRVVHLFTHDVFDFFQNAHAGRSQVYNPEASLRIIPARSISDG